MEKEGLGESRVNTKFFEHGFGIFVSLGGRLATPFRRLFLILLDSPTKKIAGSQSVLRIGVISLRGFAIPFHRFFRILLHSVATHIADPQVILSWKMILLSGFAIPFDRLRRILLYPNTRIIAEPQIVLR